jgi:hypothetical protein
MDEEEYWRAAQDGQAVVEHLTPLLDFIRLSYAINPHANSFIAVK